MCCINSGVFCLLHVSEVSDEAFVTHQLSSALNKAGTHEVTDQGAQPHLHTLLITEKGLNYSLLSVLKCHIKVQPIKV